MKKLFAVLMSIVLVLSMGTVALAAGETGAITIKNAIENSTYSVYKMLDFTPSNTEGNKGIYTVVEGWKDFFETDTAKNYFTMTEVVNDDQSKEYVVALKSDDTNVDQTLAKAALEYAKDPDNNITATATATADSATVEFTGLDLGYYVIDTTVGTMTNLTNVNPVEEVVEKNEKPDIDKFVQEDSEMNNADEGWGKVNDADIGQVVNYKSTITVGFGVTNYVMHDTMDAGLTFNADSVAVKGATKGTDYTVTTGCADGCTFEIAFTDAFIATVGKGNTFDVTYSATLNENAKVAYEDPANDGYTGNKNTVYLAYGEDHTWTTKEHETVTYTWKIDVLKFTMDGENKVSLAGAVFQLLDKDGNAIKFSEVAGAAVPTYKVDADGTITDITTNANGKFEIVGLDEGAYKLHEVSAPEGYNKLAADLDVVITSEYDEENLTATYKINAADPATIEVLNKTGGLFPETGGIGTTIFYIVGGLLMLAAVVILVSKKRMASFA